MKTYKQILFGLILSLFISSFLLAIIKPHTVQAADVSWTPTQVINGQWAFTNPTTIAVKIGTTTINLTYQGATGQGRAFSGNGAPLCSALLIYIPESSITNNQPNSNPVSADVANFKYNQTLAGGGSTGCGSPSTGPARASIDTSLAGNLGGGAQTPPNAGDPCAYSQNGQTNGNLTCTCVSGSQSVPTCTWVANAGTPPATGTTTRTCEDNGALKLEWLFCPILRGIDKAVQGFYGEVEKQLCIYTNTDPNTKTDGGTTCTKTTDLYTANTKSAWSSMRIIATSLLVVAMLAMVISQALGAGLFDAYSVRKMLPKLIAAAIFIQLSWYLCIFAINLFNDIGTGIKDLMYAPFGPNVSDIDTALGFIGAKALSVGLFAGVIATTAVVAISGLSVIGFMLLAVPVFLAVLTGYLTLVFRQILILMCVLFAPIALVAWLLPGTERYWRLWRETFIKLLMMFPLIMALIAAGHIFGSLGGQAKGLPGLIIVLVGFFGPLFILPKTFSWGGSAMSAMSGAIMGNKLVKNIGNRSAAAGREQNARYQGKKAGMYDPSEKAFGIKKGRFGVPIVTGRALRRFQSGSILPTERSRRETIAKGAKYGAERKDEAEALVELTRKKGAENAVKAGRSQDAVAESKKAVANLVNNKDDGIADAAVRKLIDTGSWPEIQDYNLPDGSRITDSPAWERAINNSPQHYAEVLKNRPDLAPHIRGFTYNDDRMDKYDIGIERNAEGEITGRDEEVRNQYRGKRLSDKHRIMEAMDAQMSNESFATASEGFYAEINRLGDKEVSKKLADRLEVISQTGEPGLRILGSMPGTSREATVNKALEINAENNLRVSDYVEQARTNAGAAGRGSDALTPSYTPAASEYQTSPPTAQTPPPTSPGSQSSRGEFGGALNRNGVSSVDIERLSHGVESGVTRANKKTSVSSGSGEIVIEHPAQNVELKAGESVSGGGVILTPGAQFNLDRNPPAPQLGTPRPSGIITPDSPDFKPPTSENLPK